MGTSLKRCLFCKKKWNLEISLHEGGLKKEYFDEIVDRPRPSEMDKGVHFTSPVGWIHTAIPYYLLVRNCVLDEPYSQRKYGLLTESLMSEQCSFYDEEEIEWDLKKGPFASSKSEVEDVLSSLDNEEVKNITGGTIRLIEKVPIPNSFMIKAALKSIVPNIPGAVLTRSYRKIDYVGPRSACVSVYVVLLSILTLKDSAAIDMGRLQGCLNGGFVTITRRSITYRTVKDTPEAQSAAEEFIQNAAKALNIETDNDVCLCGSIVCFEGGIQYGDPELLTRIGHIVTKEDEEKIKDFAKWPIVQRIVNYQAGIEFKRVSKELELALKQCESLIINRAESGEIHN